MKTLKLLVLSSLVTYSAASFAKNTSETADNINNQMLITKKAIDNVIQDIRNSKGSFNIQVDDYLAQTQDFQNSVELALQTFEANMNEKVLSKAQPLVAKLNAIQNSSLSSEQKALFLEKQKELIKKEFEKLQKVYHAEVRNLYNLIPSYQILESSDFSVSFSQPNLSFVRYSKEDQKFTSNLIIKYKNKPVLNKQVTITPHSDELYIKSNDGELFSVIELDKSNPVVTNIKETGHVTIFGNPKFNTTYTVNLNKISSEYIAKRLLSKKAVFQNIFYPALKGSCKTEACVLLRTGDYMTLNNSLDKNINIELDFNNGPTPVTMFDYYNRVTYSYLFISKAEINKHNTCYSYVATSCEYTSSYKLNTTYLELLRMNDYPETLPSGTN